MTIGLVQYELQSLNTREDFWNQINNHVKSAQEQGVKLLVFPEYVTGNLLALCPVLTHEEACQFLHEQTEEYVQTFASISRETGMIIQAGTHIVQDNGQFYNTAFLFFPDGRLETQRKVHLTPEERRAWKLSPGEEFKVFDTEFGRVAILICYDVEFPEAGRIVADKGAEIILCPSYTDAAAGFHRVKNCSQARAVENQLYVAMCGIIGEVSGVEQIDLGYSQGGLFAPCDRPFPPDGILAEGKVNERGVVVGQADLTLLKENREQGNVAPYWDRRPEVYNKA
ncbi:carbon-nitrogen hydrolase family protein [Ammoniphilus sp. CFH 90114]|uniref:carbon-nitrogen hydrolase family protein n=1 Tax=Ammoniphilus sp. CFH 90114 TaxID=2493665 RepID=UPI0010100025|nr:carbon-nitrogen hydrolase family protein [Ammoniphilus sp. CFH 90114]RXT08755.1 acyltransferase [Ammoniphilus sp. CFH 90114]